LSRSLGKVEKISSGILAQEIIPRFVDAKVNEFPVVEPGTFQMLVIDLETQWLDQMERCEGCRAQPRNASGIGRDLRLNQDDVHYLFYLPFKVEQNHEKIYRAKHVLMRSKGRQGAKRFGDPKNPPVIPL
jgi:hypothetical protein